MSNRRSMGGRLTRHLAAGGALLAVSAALAALLAVSASGGSRAAHPAAAVKATCPYTDGTVRAFATGDLAGILGTIGTGIVRSGKLWVDRINQQGGILGCKVVLDMVDEPFGDVASCLRHYREALASKKYAFYFSPVNSACMAVVPSLTNRAKVPIIANQAADHQPFFEHFQRFNFHAAVSTFLEGRASAVYAAGKGWKRIGILTPNFAYGQDVAKAFEDYFLRLVPDGKIVARQFPPSGEKNMLPYINAVVGSKPDAVFGGEFAGDLLTVWKQWQASRITIPTIFEIDGTVMGLKNGAGIPKDSGGYMRGFFSVVKSYPVGKQFFDLYEAKYGHSDVPLPSAWMFAFVSGLQMAKALAEKTGSFDAEAWAKAVEKGNFTFASPYTAGPTGVSPINHMADACAQVGPIVWNAKLKVPIYGPGTRSICMSDVVKPAETKKLTKR